MSIFGFLTPGKTKEVENLCEPLPPEVIPKNGLAEGLSSVCNVKTTMVDSWCLSIMGDVSDALLAANEAAYPLQSTN